MSDRALAKELRKRLSAQQAEDAAPEFDLAGFFFPKQFEFFRGTTKRFKVAVCSRRAGKTVGIVGDAIDLCLRERGVRVLYVTLTRENCVEIIWPDLMSKIEEYKLECKVNNLRLSVTFANGSVFSCAGAKDKREIGKFRGRKLRRIYIDEAQNFPTYLQAMIEEDLFPTLRDLRGEMFVTGTPGPLKRGFFYDISSSGKWESHNWTAFQNPHMHNPAGDLGLPVKDLEITLSEEREVTGHDKNDPKYIREAYGIWTEDLDSLVFKFNSSRNTAPASLPENMTYIFGIDLGYNDADAIAVLGYSSETNKVYLVEEKIERKQGITELVQQIEALRLKYEPVKMVMDAGALGKKIQEEIQRRHAIPLEAADKNRKLEYIELLNDDLRTGRLQAVAGTQFEEDCYLVQWERDKEDPSKLVISKSFHSDACFIAGTMIDTAAGPVPIEEVRAGDLIRTRGGYFKAKWAAKTGENRPVIRLTFTDGNVLTCTDNHPIFTENRGFVAAKNLTKFDRLVNIKLWEKTLENAQLEKQSRSTTQASTDTRCLSERTFGTITADSTAAKKPCFTEQFGSFTTGPFLQGTLSIIKTGTPEITPPRTWSACPQNSTLASTGLKKLKGPARQDSQKREKPPSCGMLAPKDWPGTENTQKEFGPEPRPWPHAPYAPELINETQCQLGQDFVVPKSAFRKLDAIPDSTTKHEHAYGVRNSTRQTSTARKNSVVGLATRETLIQRANVYNLSVDECPEYFANNILVHNCDAVLYAWRECIHYIKHERVAKPAVNTNEYMDQLEAREAEEMEQRKLGHENDWGADPDDVAAYEDDFSDFE